MVLHILYRAVLEIRLPSVSSYSSQMFAGHASSSSKAAFEAAQLRQLYIFTNPSARAGYDTRSIFKQSFTGLNSEFSFSSTSCFTKTEEPSLPYYLPIAGGRIIGFIPFPMVLVLCEMQSVSSRIWTRVAVSISFDDNHYTTGTSFVIEVVIISWLCSCVYLYMYAYICIQQMFVSYTNHCFYDWWGGLNSQQKNYSYSIGKFYAKIICIKIVPW